MSELADFKDTWHSLIIYFRSKLGFEQHTPIASEIEHRDAFKTLCDRYRERDVERLLTRLRRQHVPMIDFTTAIDQTNRFECPISLGTIFWHLSVRSVQAAFDTRLPLTEFIKETAKLNKQLPSLNRELLTRFPYEPRVQQPLKELFTEYIDCYRTMFVDAATYPSVLNLYRFQERAEVVGDLFRKHGTQWEQALEIAEAEEQRRLLSATVPSSPNGSLGQPVYSHATNAHFKYVDHLGTGTYGEVSKVMEPTTMFFYAQKLIRVRDRHDAKAREMVENQVKNEVNIMQRLRHHHIASVLFYVREPHAFSMIMLPVGDCDLRHFLEIRCVKAGFPDAEIAHMDNWFGCLISALAYAHEEEIKHEDIKPSNVLIKDNRPYLADFGSAKDFSNLEASTSGDLLVTGTPVYWPPEKKPRGRSADVFALGCVFSEMLTVRQHRSLADYRNAREVPNTDYGLAFRNNLPGVNTWLNSLEDVRKNDDMRTFLVHETMKMLRSDPEERPVAKQVKRRFRVEEDTLFCGRC